MSRVVVHIERLVLRGFGHGQQAAIAAGLQRELQRLLAAGGRATDLAGAGDLARLRVAPLQIRPGATAAEIGAQAARGIGNGMVNGDRSNPHG